MKKAVLLAFVLTAAPCWADVIEGVWVLDVPKTIGFNKSRSKISPLEETLLVCMGKNSYLKYTKSSAFSVLQEHKCEHEGKVRLIEGHRLESEYEKLYVDKEVVAMRNKTKDGHEYLSLVYKESKSYIWIYYPGESPSYEEHLRLFYKRKSSGH